MNKYIGILEEIIFVVIKYFLYGGKWIYYKV